MKKTTDTSGGTATGLIIIARFHVQHRVLLQGFQNFLIFLLKFLKSLFSDLVISIHKLAMKNVHSKYTQFSWMTYKYNA